MTVGIQDKCVCMCVCCDSKILQQRLTCFDKGVAWTHANMTNNKTGLPTSPPDLQEAQRLQVHCEGVKWVPHAELILSSCILEPKTFQF